MKAQVIRNSGNGNDIAIIIPSTCNGKELLSFLKKHKKEIDAAKAKIRVGDEVVIDIESDKSMPGEAR